MFNSPYQMPTAYNPVMNYQQQIAQLQSQMSTQPQQQMQIPVNNLIRVTGLDGAKAYTMSPNSVVPLFDDQNDVLYVKSTDGAGFPTIRTFAFTPIETAKPQQEQTDYISRTEFEEFKASLAKPSKKTSKGVDDNAEQLI